MATTATFRLVHAAADCCRYNGALVFETRAELGVCHELCANRSACRYVSHSKRYQRCALCSECAPRGGHKALGTYASYVASRADGPARANAPCTAAPARANRAGRDSAIRLAISLPVFTSAGWVEFLLANALGLSEPSTGVMLHLNEESVYPPCTVARWNGTSRIGVSPARVRVARAQGTLLYAHLLNVEAGALPSMPSAPLYTINVLILSLTC